MPLNVIVGGAEKPVSRAEVTKGGVQKAVYRVESYVDGAWKLVQSFASPLSLSIVPPAASGGSPTNTAKTVNTDTVTATPAGGLGPYTYAWVITSGTGISISSPSTASTRFSSFFSGPGERFGTAQCTVTDRYGTTATASVSITLQNGVIN